MDPVTLLVIIVILALLFGGFGIYGGGRAYGPAVSWGPFGLLLIVVILSCSSGVHTKCRSRRASPTTTSPRTSSG
jgi:hypothetical protein